MCRVIRIASFIFLVLGILIQLPSQAQSKKFFVITGKIMPEAEGNGNGTIEIVKNGKETTNIDIPKNGRFRFELEFFNEYNLTFKYPGHFNKIIQVSTEIPEAVWKRDNDFPPFPVIVQLTKEFEGVDKSFTLKPSGRIFYGNEIDNFEKESFINELQFTEQSANAQTQTNQVAKEVATINKANAQDFAAKQKEFDQLIKEADAHYQRGEYQMALIKYLEARKLFPDKAYPNDRVAELQDLVKALEINEKQKADLDQKYKTAVSKANGFFDQKSFKEARPVYEEALQYKPGDVYANGRINEIDRILAQFEKQNQYKKLIANADNEYKSKKYEQAIALYNQANALIPEDKYPQGQIDLINQELQQQAKLEQLEKDFNQAMQEASDLARKKDYPEALNTYKKALGLRPNNQMANDKVREMEQALATIENDKKYAQAILLADQALAKNDLSAAKLQYQEALKIKQEDYPKTKLAEIATMEAKEIEFSNLLAKGEKDFNESKLDEALTNLSNALKIKPQDLAVKKRIEEIQNIKNKELGEKEYAQLIAQADQDFENNKFDQSIATYTKALGIKKNEAYPQEQIKKIENLQTLLKKAEKSFQTKDYAGALQAYNNLLEVKPKDVYATSQIGEIQKIQNELKQKEEKEKALQQAYDSAIKSADELFASKNYPESINKYKEALTAKANESYPQKRIKEIETIVDKLEKEKQRIEKEYQAVIAQGEKNTQAKDYTNAIASYNSALQLKPNDEYAKAKIAEIQKIQLELKLLEEKEKADQLAYDKAIKAADQLFADKNYTESINKYKEAQAIKSDETYPQKRIKEIESTLDSIEKEKTRIEAEYKAAIAQGEKNAQAKDYTNAIASYNSALQLKPNDENAKAKIAEIQKIQLELKQLEEKEKADQLAYDKAIKAADQLFADKNYTESINKYKEAQAIKSDETYPQKRIKEIESTLDGIEKEKARIEAEYKAAIALGDDLFEKKDYANAQSSYRKALTIKTSETYPKDQVQKIDQLLAEIKRQEAEALKQQQEKLDQSFSEAMANGDNAFNSNDFNKAQTAYQTALSLKPTDSSAKKKLGETEARIAQIARNTLAYNKAITEANNQLTAKKYPEAKEKYAEALQYLPNEDYPKRQISKIDELLAQQAAEIKLHQDFDKAIAEGESLLKNKDLINAKLAFTKAYNLIPSEPLPSQKIKEINELIAEQQRIDAAEKTTIEAYQKAIQKADSHFANKEYNSAQMAYSEALVIKSAEKYPQDQLDLIRKLLTEQNENNYKAAVSKADNAFSTNQLNEATASYQEALKYRKDDQYVAQRLKEIEKKKAENELENARLQKLNTDYSALITDANNDYNNKNYPIAKEKYQKALALKPEEVYPKDQIAKIDGTLASMKQAEEINKQYAQFIQQADDNFKANQLTEARDLFQKARELKPDETIPPIHIAEIEHLIARQNEQARIAAQEEAQRKAKEKADKDMYDKAIAAAEKDFGNKQYQLAKLHYNEALIALPNEKYPREQIFKCDELLAQEAIDKMAANQKAKQDSIQKSKDQLFDAAMLMAKKLEQNEQFEQAIAKYNEAGTIKPEQHTAIQKIIDELKNKIQLYAQRDADYKSMMKRANDYFTDLKLNEALTEYQNALKVKPDEEYPKSQIKEIQNQLAARDQKYTEAIAKADKAFNQSDWMNAKSGYTEALTVKPEEVYPVTRLKEVNQKIADANSAMLGKAAEEKAYNEAIAEAEKSLKAEQLSTAKMKFQEALSIKPSEELPARRIKEIDVLIDQRNKERLAQQQREIDEKYKQTIVLADNSYKEKTYSIARLQYQQASLIKPDEQYPKTQMALMDKLMNEAKPQETYVAGQQETEPVKPAAKLLLNADESLQATAKRAENFVTTSNYDDAIKKADNSFRIKDYAVARFYYYKASEIKSSEEYPKNQIEQIKKLIDSQMSGADIAEYDKIITQADGAFDNKNYAVARFFYYKALEIKSWEKYPQDRINEINALTHSFLPEREEKEYKDLISKADEAFVNKDIAIARFYYNKALRIKNTEEYPKIKLKDIQKLIDQDALDKQNELYKSYVELGDQAMQAGNYSVARFNYNKALTIKPDEKYPKDQIKQIKEAIDNKSKETPVK